MVQAFVLVVFCAAWTGATKADSSSYHTNLGEQSDGSSVLQTTIYKQQRQECPSGQEVENDPPQWDSGKSSSECKFPLCRGSEGCGAEMPCCVIPKGGTVTSSDGSECPSYLDVAWFKDQYDAHDDARGVCKVEPCGDGVPCHVFNKQSGAVEGTRDNEHGWQYNYQQCLKPCGYDINTGEDYSDHACVKKCKDQQDAKKLMELWPGEGQGCGTDQMGENCVCDRGTSACNAGLHCCGWRTNKIPQANDWNCMNDAGYTFRKCIPSDGKFDLVGYLSKNPQIVADGGSTLAAAAGSLKYKNE
eukprot:TRINITY_DN20789_c0_g1_i1.p1 TRINITY_DN20789_c0_g1~~TRINITY_DN20789_c0_g1_i1.p1  ORF type:complete len:324 (+),score=27.71 TRINITY_DN20789_c0_g1_i1:67-972(+)